MTSSSHLFLGLPIVLLVLYLDLRSGFHSASLFLNHLSLGDVAILSANFHSFFWCVLFQHRIFARSILSKASTVLLLMYSIQSSKRTQKTTHTTEMQHITPHVSQLNPWTRHDSATPHRISFRPQQQSHTHTHAALHRQSDITSHRITPHRIAPYRIAS